MTFSKMQRCRAIVASLAICTVSLGMNEPAQAAGSVEQASDVLKILIPAIALGTSFYLDDSEGRMQFYKSAATTIGITQGLKYSVNKKRPNGLDNQSFPSSHASSAFAGAAFIHKRYGWEYGIPAYIGASFVGYSRVQAKKHYTIDVLAGAAIGIGSNLYFTEPYKGFKITPVAGGGFYGVNVSTSW